MSLAILQKDLYLTAKSKGFYDKKVVIPEVICRLILELAEVADAYNNNDDLYYEENGKPEGVAVEFVDILIPILHLFEHLNLNAESLIRKKNEYNKSREYRHGNKRF